jgi:hypothetical protein
MLLLRLPIPSSWADLAATPGVGALIAYKLIGGANYVETLLCDSVVGVTQCATVTPANAVKVDNSAVTQPVSGTITANAGTNLNTSALGTAANQATQITQETATATASGTPADVAWTAGNGSLVAVLKNIANGIASLITSVQASIPSGTNPIGTINGNPNVTLTACSATVTTGGTPVNAFTAQTTLHGFTIANIDTTEVMWISLTGTAAASGTDSYPLAPATATTFANLSSFTSPLGMGTNHALSVVAATSTHKFSCTWW